MSTLGSWLKGEGFVVDDNPVSGRDSEWHGVDWILVHHTVSDCDGSEKSISDYCKYGSSGTYPPLCQVVLGHSGKVWMTSKERSGQSDPGRASHAGSGSGYGVPKDGMNAYSLGIECQCDGSHKLATHATQYETLIRLCAALCRRYNLPASHVIGHKEWSSTGKVDPKDSMDVIRADVAEALEEDEVVDVLDYDFLDKPGGTFSATTSYKKLDQSTWNPPRDGWENTLVYLNIKPKFKSGKTHGALRVRLMRENGDAHGYEDFPIDVDDLDDGTVLKQYLTWEKGGKGDSTWIEIKCIGGLESASIGTRYTSKAVVVG